MIDLDFIRAADTQTALSWTLASLLKPTDGNNHHNHHKELHDIQILHSSTLNPNIFESSIYIYKITFSTFIHRTVGKSLRFQSSSLRSQPSIFLLPLISPLSHPALNSDMESCWWTKFLGSCLFSPMDRRICLADQTFTCTLCAWVTSSSHFEITCWGPLQTCCYCPKTGLL